MKLGKMSIDQAIKLTEQINSPKISFSPIENLDNTIAKVVKICRERAGLSQKELAEKVNMKQNKISKIENGYCTLKISELLKICEATNSKDILVALLLGQEALEYMIKKIEEEERE